MASAAPPSLRSEAEQRERAIRRRLMAYGCFAGLAYGLAARAQFFFRSGPGPKEWFPGFEVMSVGFIFGVPLAIGFISVYLARIGSFWRAAWFPQAPALTALFMSLLLAWEGLICIWLWLPLFSVLATMGGLFGWLALKLPSRIGRGSSLGVALVFPYAGMFFEQRLEKPEELRVVETVVDIAAPADAVWREIVDVPKIREEEHAFALSHFIGFPRPVAALTTGSGVGSVRQASFERGVVFVEKVTEFETNRLLSFSIHANAESIPARALDEHVTVGGPYFDVLEGTYRLEEVPGGTRLYLSSRHRLSTHFNFYAGLWTDFIMRDTQQYILRVVAERAQAHAG